MKNLRSTFRCLLAAFTLFCLAVTLMSLQPAATDGNSDYTLDNCPTASFSIVNNGVNTSTPVVFVNQSIGADSYHWDFGDGNSSCEDAPSHTYSTAGTYTVKLKAIIEGCTVEFVGTEDVVIY